MDGWMDGWMDGVILIRCFDGWMVLYGSGGVSCAAARDLFLFVCFFEPFFYPPGAILGWFWEAKTAPKIDFFGVLFRMRFFDRFFTIFC